MSLFGITKSVNVFYIASIVSIALYNNFIQINPDSAIGDRVLIVLAAVVVTIPNIFLVSALSRRFILLKTTIVVNLACAILFVVGLLSHKQESLVIWWGVTVISLCALNVCAMIVAYNIKHRRLADHNEVVYP